MKKIPIILAFVISSLSPVLAYQEIVLPQKEGPHFLYLPNKMDVSKTYWVVVGVHGADWRNKGANGMARWADRKGHVIVLGPKFSKTYQNANEHDQTLLISMFEYLQKQYKVHPKMFIYGFSGGSQFAHRFAMKQPDYVCGVSSHSGGSWGTDAYGKINEKAKHIPFAISCGEKDTGKAWKNAPYNRLVWFRRFRDAIAAKQFFYKAASWPNVGHRDSPGVWKMTEECFQLATTGMLPGSDLFEKLAEAKTLAKTGEFDKAATLKYELTKGSITLSEASGWNDSKEALAMRRELVKNALASIDTSPATRRRYGMYKRCVELIKSNEKPSDNALLAFIQQCPPSFWNGKKDNEIVFSACNSATRNHIAELRERKQLSASVYKKYIPLWNGLEAREELLKEYDAEANKHLQKVLAMQDGYFKQNALRSFIRQWQVGAAVETARTALGTEK